MRILAIQERRHGLNAADPSLERDLTLLRGANVEVKLWEWDPTSSDESIGSALAENLNELKPRLVHVYGFTPEATPSLHDACHDAGLPVVQTLNDFRIIKEPAAPARPWLHRLLGREKKIGTHRKTTADAFIAPSKFAAKELVGGGVPGDKIHVRGSFAFEPPSDTLRASDMYAVFAGNLTEESGIRTVLKAWEELTTPIWIIGEGPLLEEVSAKKGHFVKVLGAMPATSVIRILSKAEFLLIPAESPEYFPLFLPDAFSLGLPVIASRIGALAENIRHEKNGLLFAPSNVENLQSIVRKLTKDNSLHGRLSAGARADYLLRFSPKKNLQALLEIYQAAMKVRKTEAKL